MHRRGTCVPAALSKKTVAPPSARGASAGNCDRTVVTSMAGHPTRRRARAQTAAVTGSITYFYNPAFRYRTKNCDTMSRKPLSRLPMRGVGRNTAVHPAHRPLVNHFFRPHVLDTTL